MRRFSTRRPSLAKVANRRFGNLRKVTRVALALAALFLLRSMVLAQSGGDFDLSWSSIDGGGGTSTGGVFRVDGVAGQPDAAWLSGGVFVVEGGFFFPGFGPTAVVVASFQATPVSGGVLLTWETLSEYQTLGFNLYRSQSPGNLGEQLNETLIPARAPGQGEGAQYEFPDATVLPGVLYHYTLEEVDTLGRGTLHGPVAVVSLAEVRWWSYLPLVMRDR